MSDDPRLLKIMTENDFIFLRRTHQAILNVIAQGQARLENAEDAKFVALDTFKTLQQITHIADFNTDILEAHNDALLALIDGLTATLKREKGYASVAWMDRLDDILEQLTPLTRLLVLSELDPTRPDYPTDERLREYGMEPPTSRDMSPKRP